MEQILKEVASADREEGSEPFEGEPKEPIAKEWMIFLKELRHCSLRSGFDMPMTWEIDYGIATRQASAMPPHPCQKRIQVDQDEATPLFMGMVLPQVLACRHL